MSIRMTVLVGVVLLVLALTGVVLCAIWLPIIPSKWYYLQKAVLRREVADVRSGALALRNDGYQGFQIDGPSSKAGVQLIQAKDDVIYFTFYSDPVQSKGILFSKNQLTGERVNGAGSAMCDVSFVAKDDVGYWYSFVSE